MRPYALFAFALMPAIVAASGCCPANAEPAGDDPVLAAWAQLIPHAGCTIAQERRPVNACDPELVIRAVVRPGTTCPEIRISGDENLLTMAERPNPAKDDIEVRVCEASVDRRKAGQASLTNSRKTVSWSAFVRSDALDRVVVIGDTGCRNEQGQEGCDASGGEEGAAGRGWPFARVADVAAKTKPGLVIHVGDFRYRHESGPDTWEDWKKDVFDPAAPLLAAAPWIIARGNHDLCFKTKGGYKGNGWPLFFGPKLGDNPKNCRETADARAAAPPALPPYALDVMPELRLVVLDSSGSYYGCAEWGRAFDDWTRGGFADLFRPGGQDKADPQTGKADQRRVWLVTHYPV